MDKKIISFVIIKNEFIPVSENENSEISVPGKIIYEVIRVISGKLLFLEDHIDRFQNSFLQSGYTSPVSPTEISEQLKKLVSKNQITIGNIKFFCNITDTNEIEFYAHFIPHRYPTEKDYLNGIKLTLFEAQRKNPGIKEENKLLRESAQAKILNQQAYEALLVNPLGYITEGSKSNFFLIKENTIYTSLPNDVLEGITSKKLIELLKNLKIPLKEQPITVNSLPSFEAAFITGTSPSILPVNIIDSLIYDPANALLREIMTQFDLLIENYLKIH